MPPLANSPETTSESRRAAKTQRFNEQIAHNINEVNERWSLSVVSPQPNDSPSNRTRSKEQECGFLVRLICFKGPEHINEVRKKFDPQAEDLYKRWRRIPNADRDRLPRATRDKPRPTTAAEQSQLLDLFLNTLREHRRLLFPGISTPQHTQVLRQFNDTPIPSPFPRRNSSTDSKRQGENLDNNESAKKLRPNPFVTGEPSNVMPPPKSRPFAPTSANTSFASVTSDTGSIFSAQAESSFVNTQSTVPDNDENELPDREKGIQFTTTRQPETADSSDYASSSFERKLAALSESELLGRPSNPDPHVNEDLSQGFDEFGLSETPPERMLKEKLSKVFPELPLSLRFATTRSIYEITRVFLHAEVSMENINFPSASDLDDYPTLWRFLQNVPALKDKSFPEKCAQDVWNGAKDTYTQGFHGVYFSGSLHFTKDSVFSLKLDPMKWDRTHRLGRRFGMDRFLEIDIPHLTGPFVPKSEDLGNFGRNIIENWLIDPRTRTRAYGGHSLLGRLWKPFFQKEKDRKDKKKSSTKLYSDEPEAANRIYFFAIDGFNKTQPAMDIQGLLDSFRLTKDNGHQPFLKLFARTSLVLSRNSATVVLNESQIHYIPDIMSQSGKEKETEMTDGAGRMSQSLALKIGKLLALPDSPSGFQGRIAEAKGFWSVDYNNSRPEESGDWIEICESQCKWKWDRKVNALHPTNRTFEVLRFSGPLKPADLNLQFLPVLMDRAKDQGEMKRALSKLLEVGLDEKLLNLQVAMEDPQGFRLWLRESNANIDDRIKHGIVPYRAGLPITTDERLNLLLDAGYSPHTLKFVKNLALTAFENKCFELQRRLNITVGRSCYVYMIPDFTGTLEPDEIHLDFSRFHDNATGASNVLLKDVDLLVARSPTHYPSDIQMVRAVLKQGLLGLKDVIVFSTKGKTSLASKLSGGDYDGDIAWVCWEESIVNNFESVEVPELPDLVEEGLIKQNKMTYNDLIKDKQDDATFVFLKNSFHFNMEQNMLGICTNYKEKVCYTHVRKHIQTSTQAIEESLYLSTLLSCLVDKAKQGYIFNEQDWIKFKAAKILTKPREPEYLQGDGVVYRKTSHIVDQLKWDAQEKIKEAIINFHSDFHDPRCNDDDLCSYFRWAQGKATEEMEKRKALGIEEPGSWETVKKHLENSIKDLRNRWDKESVSYRTREEKAERANKGKGKMLKPSADETYVKRTEGFFYKYEAIVPPEDTPFTQALNPDCFDPGLTSWALLKASALFYSYGDKQFGRFPWFMAGRQAACLKAYALARDNDKGLPHVVSPHMYAMSKPDAAFIKRRKALQSAPTWDENCSIANVDEMDDWED